MKKRQISCNKKSRLLSVFAAIMASVLMAVPVMAAPLEKDVTVKPSNGDADFTVTFTAGGEMNANFTDKDMFSVTGAQPGDTVVFKIKVVNEYGKDTDWYMLNAVLDSLEGKNKEGGANANSNTTGGAYEYSLTYQGPSAAQPEDIFRSDTVGGSDENIAKGSEREGLKAATSNLKDFFWFDRLKAGESGWVELRIKLEGESQGNNYQDTFADLQMRFAVEVPAEVTETKGEKESKKPAQTNDSMEMNIYLYIGLAALVLMVLAAGGFIAYRKKSEGSGEDRS